MDPTGFEFRCIHCGSTDIDIWTCYCPDSEISFRCKRCEAEWDAHKMCYIDGKPISELSFEAL